MIFYYIMSESCIHACPRIQIAIENTPEGAHPTVAAAQILAACVETYSCDAPIPTTLEVPVGILRRRIEQRPGFICGLTDLAETE